MRSLPLLLAAALVGCAGRAPAPPPEATPSAPAPEPRVDPRRRPPQPVQTVRQGGLRLDADGWLGRPEDGGVALTRPGVALRVSVRAGTREELDERYGGPLAWGDDGPYGPLAALQGGALATASRPTPSDALAVAWFLDRGVLVEAEVGPERFEEAWAALRALLATARWEDE